MLVKRFSAPQIMGYIGAGILLGHTGFHVIQDSDIQNLQPFNMFTLGLIGFLVGSEIRFSTMRKYGKQFASILLGEGLSAFILVGVASSIVVFIVSHSLPASIAAGVVLGAVASATDPASTVSVLWEYRCAGIFTTTVTTIVALDDALAMTLYGLGTGLAHVLVGGESHLGMEILKILWELSASLGIGIIGGLASNFILRKSKSHNNVLTSSIGLLLLSIGVAVIGKFDVILASMSFGVTLVNMAPKRSKPYVDLIRQLSPPFYVMFFVLVGARISLAAMPAWLWLLVGSYVIFRSIGKMGGAWLGAIAMKADKKVRDNCGTALFAQGGVAIGLSVMAGQRLSGIMVTPDLSLPDVLVFTITTTTFIVQLIGPPLTKFAAKRAGEIDRDINEEDIMKKLRVADAVLRDVPTVKTEDNAQAIIKAYVGGPASQIPVIDANGKLGGIIKPEEIKNILLEQSVWEWLLAADIAEPPSETLTVDQELTSALHTLNQLGADEIPVVDKENHFVGLINRASANKSVRHELVQSNAAGAAKAEA